MKQDRKFASRVQLYSPTGRWLREISAVEAARLLRVGSKERKGTNGKVREIELAHLPGRPCGPPTTPSLSALRRDHRYTYAEPVHDRAGEVCGHCIEFKFIHPGDQALFMLALTDCGGELKRKVVKYAGQ